MKKILEGVVSEGGGTKAYIDGYSIGGKTATSQKLPRGSGKYIMVEQLLLLLLRHCMKIYCRILV